MRRLLPLIAAAVLIASSAAAGTGRYLVGTRGSLRSAGVLHPAQAGLTTDAADSHAANDFEFVSGFAATLTDEEVAALRHAPGVRFVEPVVERHILEGSSAQRSATSLVTIADDTLYTPQLTPPGVTMVRAPEVWSVSRGAGINVAIIDTGIDYHHPDLAANFAGGTNIIYKNEDPFDDNGHGTHVAGTIGALDNGFGVVGVAPSVRIWSVKVLNNIGSGPNEGIINAVDWIIRTKSVVGGNWVISLSLGSVDSSELERDAFQRASDAGILTFAASGNDGTTDALSYPAGYSSVIAVGAVDSAKAVADFSNRGSALRLVGPGVHVLSSVPVGTQQTSGVIAEGHTFYAFPLVGSPTGTVIGQYVDCVEGKLGQFPPNTRGNIAVIRRGPAGVMTFAEKARNAKAAGAAAVVIYNYDPTPIPIRWTLIGALCDATGANCVPNPAEASFEWPLTLGMTFDDGMNLLRTGTLQSTATVSYRNDDYGFKEGTSMATPHVSGAAALAWSVAPNATASDVATALFHTAEDLGDSGRDAVYGFGLVNVFRASYMLAPGRFGSDAGPVPTLPAKHRAGKH